MRRTTLFTLGRSLALFLALPLSAAALDGCSKDSCTVDNMGPECVNNPDMAGGSFSVGTQRVSITNPAQLTVTLPAGFDTTATFKLRQSGATDLALTASGGKITIPAASLKTNQFKPGPADIVVSQSGKGDQKAAIRFYLQPDYSGTANPQTIRTVAGENPLWAGPGLNRNVVVMEAGTGVYTGHFVEYPVGGGLPVERAKLFQSGAKAAMFSGQIFVATPSIYGGRNNQIDLSSFQLNTSLNPFTVERMETAAASVAVDPKGTLLAAILDNKIIAYPISGSLTSSSQASGAQAPSGTPMPTLLASGDVNGDGIADLVLYQATPQSASVLIGRGNTWSEDATLSAQVKGLVAGQTVNSMILADIDTDGLDDLVITSENKELAYFGNTGATAAGQPRFAAATRVTLTNPSASVAVGDVDGMGGPDVVVVDQTAKEVKVYVNQTMY